MANRTTPKQVSFIEKIKQFSSNVRGRIPTRRLIHYVDTKPFTSFFILLGALLLLIILGNVIAGLSKKETPKQTLVKEASVYRIGSTPKVSMQGQVEKSGVFKIVAQTAGIVQRINLREGESVTVGDSIMTLSSNYQGWNIPALQASLAQKQYQNILDTYDTQKALLDDQKSVATASAQNTEDLRVISQRNLDDTSSLISQNSDILNTLNNQLQTLKNTNTNGSNDAQILTLRQSIAQLQGGLTQLQATQRALSYQANLSNPPTTLSNTQKDIALRQLDIQQKSLDLNKEVSRIQSAIAGISASFMNPTSPCNGTVDRIYVKEGDSVTPGTVLALVSGDKKSGTLVVRVPADIAMHLSRTDTSTLHLANETYDELPTYVSQEATDNQLYSVIYTIPDEYQKDITDSGYIGIDMPIGYADTSATIPFIPLDAVYQTQNEAYVLVVENGKAVGRKVTLGTVYGRYVQILFGLKNKDQVIENRNIIAGDSIKTQY